MAIGYSSVTQTGLRKLSGTVLQDNAGQTVYTPPFPEHLPGLRSEHERFIFDTDTGKRLWEVKLPAGGQATPMTYAVNGRQYVVIAAGGYKGDSTRGDYLVAYALPR